MRFFIYSVLLNLINWAVVIAQPQVTFLLTTDQGVKKAEYLTFLIYNDKSSSHDILFEEFSKKGEYANLNLYQHSENVDVGTYTMKAVLKSGSEAIILDTLVIDSLTARVEIDLNVSVTETGNECIKIIQTTIYKNHPRLLNIFFNSATEIGASARFRIHNKGVTGVYGYPVTGMFVGTLYKEVKQGRWVKYTPAQISELCKSEALIKLMPEETTTGLVPGGEDCKAFQFKESGSYYAEFLYSMDPVPLINTVRETQLVKRVVFREVVAFQIFDSI